MAVIPKNYARLETGYREKALKIYPWVCGFSLLSIER